MQGDPDRQSVSVPFSDDEAEGKETTAEDLFADDPPNASPEERITRKQKRESRVKRLLDDGKQSKEEVTRLREEQAALKTELAELRGQVRSQPAPQQAADGKDQWERALDAVYEKQSEAYNAAQAEIAANKWTPERQKHYERIAREVESEKTRIHTDRAVTAQRHLQRSENAQQQWINKYPEVYGNPRAYQYAEATFKRRSALGEPVTNDMVDEVMADTLTQFRLRGKPAPTANERSRYAGTPSSGGAGGGGGAGGIKLTPELRRIAIAAHSELPEAEAIKKWVNTTGKRMREKKLL